MVCTHLGLEGRRAVLEEFLLPSAEDRWLESHLIAELRNRHLVQQMPPAGLRLSPGLRTAFWSFYAFSPLS